MRELKECVSENWDLLILLGISLFFTILNPQSAPF